MKRIRMLSLICAVLLMLSVFAGCSGEKKVSSDDEVTLKWVCIGTTGQKDAQKVWDYFNERLTEYLPNTKVEFEIISPSEYAEKWRLKAAAQEPIDIAWTGYTNTYLDEINNGSFLPLNKLLDEYGKELKEELPDWVWKKAEYQGEIYSIPNYQMMNITRRGFTVKEDVMNKYMTEEISKKISESAQSHDTIQPEDFDAMEEFLKILKDNGALLDGVDPVSMSGLASFKGYEQVMSESMPFGYRLDDSDMKIVNFFEEESYKTCFSKMAEWYKKGYIREDIASAVTNELVFSVSSNAYYDIPVKHADPSKRTITLPLDNNFFISAAQSNTSTVIPRTAKNPERAMQLLNIINTKEGAELLNILGYGIEGEHYTKVSDRIVDTAITFENGAAKYSGLLWAFGNIFNAYDTVGNGEGWNDYVKNDINGKAVISPTMGFKPDLSNISLEISQVSTVIGEFANQLKQGVLPNWEQKYDEMIKKMKTAGSDTIVKELQKQLDQWCSENGK